MVFLWIEIGIEISKLSSVRCIICLGLPYEPESNFYGEDWKPVILAPLFSKDGIG